MRRTPAGLALLAAAVFLTAACSGGGGGDNGQGTTQPTNTVPVVTSTTAPAGDLETFEVFSTKNPFTPLAGTATGGTGTGTGTGTGATTGGTGGTTGGTTGATTTGEGGTTGGVEPQRAQRIALLDVFVEGGEVKANVRVNSTVHKVGVGETFADRYKVLSLSQSDDCGRFLFGDDAFRLCRGEQTLK
jgi:hypothetical protein